MLSRSKIMPKVPSWHFSSIRKQSDGLKVILASRRGYRASPLLESARQDGAGSIYKNLSQSGKVTVITGGARGIGLALAEVTAELGGTVAILDRMEPHTDLARFKNAYGTKAKFYRTDVTKQGSLENSFNQVVEDLGGVNNCITAAGISLDKPFLEHNWEESLSVLNVNVLGTFFSAQLAAKHMRDGGKGGSIVMIASIAAHCAIPSQRVSIYGASKAAVKLLGKTLAVEMAPFGIRVNTLSPGFIATDMTGDMAVTNPELHKVFSRTPPQGRIGQKSDLTSAVAYFLSEGASYTTGADLVVTGGLHAGRIQV